MEITKGDLETCLRVVESLVADRLKLQDLSTEERKSLLIAAGRLSRPDKLEQMRLAKTHHRMKKRAKRAVDEQVRNQSGIRQQRERTVFEPFLQIAPPKIPPKRLSQPRNCYVCKIKYDELHHFYDSMCKQCGDLNYEKRFQTANMGGRVALVTGARVKIGIQTSLKLLRAGARVIATTRFPRDAAKRYSREGDFGDWRDRLDIYGLDLRHSPSVEIFSGFINRHYEKLDVLINNAAQTVRRPPGFYRHLTEFELRPFAQLDTETQRLLAAHEDCKATLTDRLGSAKGNLLESHSPFSQAAVGIENSASLSLIPYAYDDETAASLDVFPAGETDADLQQVDLRAMNSWRLTLSEVHTPEMLEVHLVNAVAPFILCGKLKSLMERSSNIDKHVINVSAMEGKFTRYTKTDKHPHTNMAKAALNMMTATSAPDYLKSNIYMNAVDTGWVTDEDPAVFAKRKLEELNFQPPLDIVDGASRILDPLFSGLLTGKHLHGRFLKDYFPTDW